MTQRGNPRHGVKAARRLALGASALALALAWAGPAAFAQDVVNPLPAAVNVAPDAKMFLEADTVTYDSQSAVVTAAGGVQIDYGGYKLVARQVTYNQKTRRLLAAGDVQLVQPDGNRVYADSADITDDFADGFVSALRLETPENTRFAAAGAVREGGTVTTFERGVYTACEACAEHPERAPLWQVKARKIIWDQQEKVVRYYGAQFELWGQPIAYFPYFSQPDPTVKRKSGFLQPGFRSSSELGFGLRVPYFFALSDSNDITVAGTYYTKQGFLAEAEYRQALENGYFTLQTAGISQNDPDAFYDTSPIGQSPDYLNAERGMIGTTGRFALSDQWTFGWDILAQSDQNFSKRYEIENFNQTFHTSEVYLTGLGDRSFFDLRAQRFEIQTEVEADQDVQPDVFPTLDYQRIEDDVAGGELEVNVNALNLHRGSAENGYNFPGSFLLCDPDLFIDGACSSQAALAAGLASGFPYRYDYFRRRALEGDYSRGTLDAEWRRTFTTDAGLQLTPFLGARGDVYRADMSVQSYDFFPSNPAFPVGPANPYRSLGGIDIDNAGFRGMATAGLEARYPVVIEAQGSTHIIEPIAQVLLRPNETNVGDLPNEDAQSLVFSASNLFSTDKFSGYDRIEGGSRANVGLRYSGIYDSGYAIDAVVGQSYHLAGINPYSQYDLALVGADSGLETDVSDYVGGVSLATPIGFNFGLQGRLDEETFEVRRTDFTGGYSNSRFGVNVTYSQIAAQPIYGFPDDRSQIGAGASLKLTENWSTFGSLGYDIENSELISKSFGVNYLDECFSLLASYTQTEDNYQLTDAQNTIMFRFGLRTLADAEYKYKIDE